MSKSLFLLMALIVGPAFAADGVVSRTVPSNLNTSSSAGEDTVARGTSRTTVSRTKVATDGTKESSRGTASASRSTVSRSTTARTTADTSRGTTSRAMADTTKSTVSRSTVGDINENPVVRRAGVVLRPSFADYGGRATIAGTDQQTGSNIKSDIQKISSRVAKATQATKESIVAAREQMELTAELNQSCQEQYNECMDQFCAIVDENQKRCSCSGNLSRYTKVEKAVTEANAKLNEVAQSIRYVGLSADEIRAIMTETEAEEALDDTKDTSTTRNMLKQIESMIKDPTSSTTSYSSDTTWGFGLDMDLTFSSDPIDIFNLDFLTTGVNNSSISNLRGTELYNTAKKRCKTILTKCKDAGATQDQITGNYDLAIDKDCIAYEAGLKKMNETLLSNVKSANLMLQKARLAVLENKNQYDARGCVGALEACMKDEMVCGDDYYKCVDPTKAYIDENGEVVLGQDITVIQSFMTEYNNAAINENYLSGAYGVDIGANKCTGDGKCVVKYLLQKIGTKERAMDEGMCRPVLDKCRYYSYDSKTNKYKPYNDIVVNYIQRAMVSIKAAQQKIISDYASSCIIDVATCYNQQVTQVNSWASAASAANIYNVMRGACRSVALTCGLAIFTGKPEIDPNQTLTVDGKDYNVSGCPAAGGYDYASSSYNDAIITCISNMFYQSLLCPDNSTYQAEEGAIDQNNTNAGWVNTKCKCNAGYDVFSGSCLPACGGGQSRNSNGTCYCTDGVYSVLKNGVCYDRNGYTIYGGNSSSSGGGSSSSTGPSGSVVSGDCTGAATTPTWQGCVASGWRCNNLVSSDGTCVNPCAGISNATPGQVCQNADSNRCVKQYCQCNSGYKVSGTSCVVDNGQSGTGGGTGGDTTQYSMAFDCGEGSVKSGATLPSSTYGSTGITITVPDGNQYCTAPTNKIFSHWSCNNGRTYTAGVSLETGANSISCSAIYSSNGGTGGGGTGETPEHAEPATNCTYNDPNNTWMGCIGNGYRCQTGFVSNGSGACENPCAGVLGNSGHAAIPTSGCTTLQDGVTEGCVALYCKCPYDTYANVSASRCIVVGGGGTVYTVTFKCGDGEGADHVESSETQGGWVQTPTGGCTKDGQTVNMWICDDGGHTPGSSMNANNQTCVASYTESSLAPQAQATATTLNNSTPTLQASPLRSNSSYSLIQTADMCMLYSTPSGTDTSEFVAMTDCETNLDDL